MLSVNESQALTGVVTGRITDVDNASLRMMADEILFARSVLHKIRRTFAGRWGDVRTITGTPSSTQEIDAYLERVAAADATAAPDAGLPEPQGSRP